MGGSTDPGPGAVLFILVKGEDDVPFRCGIGEEILNQFG